MMAAGPFQGLIVLLILLGGGGDLVSSVPAKEYFEYREIDPTLDKLVDLAQTVPLTGKDQITQLMALRQLATDAEQLKKSPKLAETRALLAMIVDGKKAHDATGFAAEYAARVLRRLDGAADPTPKRGDWKEGAAWIPADAQVLIAADSKDVAAKDRIIPDLSRYAAALKPFLKKAMFEELERIGNVRIERVAIGASPLPNDEANSYLHFTGKAHPGRLIAALRSVGVAIENVEVRQIEGRTVRVVLPKRFEPAVAVVDDTDLIIADVIRNRAGDPKDAADNLDRMLQLVAKPGTNATAGPLKDLLAKLPEKTRMVVAAKQLDRFGKAPFPVPTEAVATIVPIADGLELRASATMRNEEDAQWLVDMAKTVAKDLRAKVGAAKAKDDKSDNVAFDRIESAIEGLEIRIEGSQVTLRAAVSTQALRALAALFMRS
jgi:hypothetical protein